MTRDDLVKFFEERTSEMVRVMKAKNADYAGEGGNPFANFTRVENLGICKTEQGFLTRMTDKLCRITSFVQAGTLQVKSESVQDTLLDLANYSLLMAAYIESKSIKSLDAMNVATKEYENVNPLPQRDCTHEVAKRFDLVECKYYCSTCNKDLSV